MRKLGRFLLCCFFVSVILFSSAYLGLWYYLEYDISDLPDVKILIDYDLKLPSVVYADDGEIIDKFVLQERIYLPYNSIPPHVADAIIAIEDKNFWSKRLIAGIDPARILKASLDNFWATAKESWRVSRKNVRFEIKPQIVAGGSTITQQVAKLVWLTQEKTASRKLKEIRIAHQMEKKLPRELIFEIYTNLIYMGHNRYGIAAGADYYFGKLPHQLSVDEAATLAGLIKWPYKFSPVNNAEIAKRRRNLVLERMYNVGFISHQEFRDLKDKEMVLLARRRQDAHAPHLSSFIMQELHRRGYESLMNAGLKISTTINLDIQRVASQSLIKGLEDYDKRHDRRLVLYNIFDDYELKSLNEFSAESWSGLMGVGSVVDGLVIEAKDQYVLVKIGKEYSTVTSEAFSKIREAPEDLKQIFSVGDVLLLKIVGIDDQKNFKVEIIQPRAEGAAVVLDVQTGAIKAMVGGRDFASSKYNRALQAERQAGSAFKPFVYGAYFEKYPEKDLESQVLDSPICFKTGNPKKPKWCPRNYEEKSLPPFMGPISIRIAMARSRNVAAVYAAHKTGINDVVNLANRLGITSDLPRYLPTAIGAGDVKIIDMARAFSVFFRQGVDKPHWFLQSVVGKDGLVRSFEPQVEERVLGRDAADKILLAMRWVVLAGTGRSAFRELPFAVAGKTGTTNNFTDAWFVGGTPRYVVAVWVGFDQKAIPLVSRESAFKETGGATALPIFIDIMKGIYEKHSRDEFPESIEVKIKGEKKDDKAEEKKKD